MGKISKAVSGLIDSTDKLKEAMVAASQDMGGFIEEVELRDDISEMSSDFSYHCKYDKTEAAVAAEQVLFN